MFQILNVGKNQHRENKGKQFRENKPETLKQRKNYDHCLIS